MSAINLPLITPWLAFGGLVILTIRWMYRPTILTKLPVPPGGNWFFGHFKKFAGPEGLEYQGQVLLTYGPTTMLKGLIGRQILFTIDPAVIHAVQIKDKDKFHRTKGSGVAFRTIFGGGLLALSPEEHRVQRKLLNPVFNMKYLRELSSTGSEEVNIFPWITAAALDLVGEAGLGYSFNSFAGERNEYSTAIKKVTESIAKIGPLIQLLPYVHQIGTPAFRQWVLDLIHYKPIQNLRHAIKLQNDQAEEIILARQALLSAGSGLSSEAGRGKDIMTLLMKANESGESESYIDHQSMVGHMNTFIFGGHETTSAAVTRILDILAQRPDVQVKLREELQRYFEKNPKETHHDALLELSYLDGIVREVLRLFPPVRNIPRVCLEDTVLPLEYPVNTPSGKITSIPIKKGTPIMISIVYFNRNEAIWGERANEFLPERWVGSKIDEVTQAGSRLPGVYSSMMTFGSGSYACIGFKFAVMEIKVMLAELITKFKFEPSDEEYTWVNLGIRFPYTPYAKKDLTNPDKSPKFFLKVTKL
ncbi:cytochrome P450-dit2 [Ceratobasidium sp. 423]|nr:cytochrome P450-dit2 [Ceratobasidium sp. 423]